MNVVQLGKIITGFNKDAELRGPGKKGVGTTVRKVMFYKLLCWRKCSERYLCLKRKIQVVPGI